MAADGDRGGPPPGPAGYAEWLAASDLELRDGRLVRRPRFCAALPSGEVRHLVTLAEIEGDCRCCRDYGPAHNRNACSACGHAAGDTGTLLVAVPCKEHDPKYLPDLGR